MKPLVLLVLFCSVGAAPVTQLGDLVIESGDDLLQVKGEAVASAVTATFTGAKNATMNFIGEASPPFGHWSDIWTGATTDVIEANQAVITAIVEIKRLVGQTIEEIIENNQETINAALNGEAVINAAALKAQVLNEVLDETFGADSAFGASLNFNFNTTWPYITISGWEFEPINETIVFDPSNVIEAAVNATTEAIENAVNAKITLAGLDVSTVLGGAKEDLSSSITVASDSAASFIGQLGEALTSAITQFTTTVAQLPEKVSKLFDSGREREIVRPPKQPCDSRVCQEILQQQHNLLVQQEQLESHPNYPDVFAQQDNPNPLDLVPTEEEQDSFVQPISPFDTIEKLPEQTDEEQEQPEAADPVSDDLHDALADQIADVQEEMPAADQSALPSEPLVAVMMPAFPSDGDLVDQSELSSEPLGAVLMPAAPSDEDFRLSPDVEVHSSETEPLVAVVIPEFHAPGAQSSHVPDDQSDHVLDDQSDHVDEEVSDGVAVHHVEEVDATEEVVEQQQEVEHPIGSYDSPVRVINAQLTH